MLTYSSNTLRGFCGLLKRDFRLGLRSKSDLFVPLLFFALVVTLFIFALGDQSILLSQWAPAILWTPALLALLLSLENLFHRDYKDGTLEQLFLMPQPLSLLVFAKLLCHWCLYSLPLILVTPVLAMMLHLSLDTLIILMISLLLGTPTLTCIGAMGAALTLNTQRSGILIPLIVLPLEIPVIIWATSAVEYSVKGLPLSGIWALLGAFLIFFVTVSPFFIAWSLQLTTE